MATGFELLHLSAHVVVHGVGPPVRVHRQQHRGRGARGKGQGQLRLSDGVDLDRVRDRAELRADAGRRHARLEGLRYRDATE